VSITPLTQPRPHTTTSAKPNSLSQLRRYSRQVGRYPTPLHPAIAICPDSLRFAMEAGHPSLYLVYDYMEGGDLGSSLAHCDDGSGLTHAERLKVGARPGGFLGRGWGCLCMSVEMGGGWAMHFEQPFGAG
jgi:hypothetical protein